MGLSPELLKRIILDQHEGQYWPPKYIQRTVEKKLYALQENQEIIVLRGVRRCGKSILLESVRRNYQNENDYYFNFEDERLVNFSSEDFEIFHQTLISLYGIQKRFFFDEIQNIPGWELFVRRMYNKGDKIYITGSNANLFSEELGTRLTGRYVSLTIYPISFAETSQFHFPLDQQNFSSTDIGLLRGLFASYLEYGGIPSYIFNKNIDYLHSLYESIVYRDLIVRYKIGNPEALKKLIYYLASNCAKEISYSKLLGMINNNGKVINSITTISEYCSYIENSFLCFFVNKYDESIKVQQQAPKKIYFIDHVLAKIIGFRANHDHGRMLENIVFLELKRRDFEIYYHKKVKECDFVLRRRNQTLEVMQVCSDVSDPFTKEREIAGLVEAMDEFSLSKGIIVTENEEQHETITMKDKQYDIAIVPIWKWLRIAN